MADNIHVEAEVVDINSLKSYAQNPRRGDVESIAKSLEINGQYKPIVVNKKTKTILAGNHTWRAARSLGWTHIAVTYVDVDDKQAQKIVLADNRTSDMSSYDDARLLELLESLPSLDGTGYHDVDIEQLQSLLAGDGEFETQTTERTGKVGTEVRVSVGNYRIMVDDDVYHEWAQKLKDEWPQEDALMIELRKKLDLVDVKAIPPTPRKGKTKRDVVRDSNIKSVMVSTENIDINSVFPYPMNARQGDIGMISESLRKNGQFRPIVVNKRDNSILVGNHTWKAAKLLGWKEISATFVDLDEEAATRIVLADNKIADLGSYDHVQLAEMLRDMPDFDGTGYSPEDIDDLVREVAGWGIKEKPTKEVENDKPRNVTAIVGEWEIKMEPSYFDIWEERMFHSFGYSFDEVCGGMASMLGIPDDAWVSTRQRKSKRKSARRSKNEEV